MKSWTYGKLEVRLKNSGLDAIEVQDNGCGIAPDDFESIGEFNLNVNISHHTG